MIDFGLQTDKLLITGLWSDERGQVIFGIRIPAQLKVPDGNVVATLSVPGRVGKAELFQERNSPTNVIFLLTSDQTPSVGELDIIKVIVTAV